jgi:circadian clock protein KaiC
MTMVVEERTGAAEANLPAGSIAKTPTGIFGLDEMTQGGLPTGRMTAIVGFPGAGKTVLALQTALHRIRLTDEGCIFVALEESPERIMGNVAGFDWDPSLIQGERMRFVDAKMAIALVSSGFDISGLLAELTALADEIGAGAVVFDGLDMLLDAMNDRRLERRELSRLADWIGESGLSAIITVKAFDDGSLEQSRAAFLQYMTDCVIVLERAVTPTEASRTLRIAKYRGSNFAANPAPLVINETGFEVVSLDPQRSDYPTFQDRVSSGVPRLDALMNGGYLRGSSVLASGSPGTSKTSLAASFVAAACARGERALFVSFDESGAQVVANMRSIGLDLQPFVDCGLLRFTSLVSAGRSPEEHYVKIYRLIDGLQPSCMVIDPFSALLKSGFPFASQICVAIMDFAKSRGVTIFITSLLDHMDGMAEASASQVSTIADTWIHVSNVVRGGERNRALTIIKSRGTAHSNQVRELVLSETGVDLVDAYIAEGEVLMGSARAQKEAELAERDQRRHFDMRAAHLRLEREISELAHKVKGDTAALEAKQRELQLLAVADQQQTAARMAAARHRAEMRRPTDLQDLAGPLSNPIPRTPAG